MKKTFLLTSFEPFGHISSNSSKDVVDFITLNNDDIELIKVCLPVTYKEVPIKIKELLDQYQPNYLLLNGQASSREKITIEQIAINLIDSLSPDNDGVIKTNELIDQQGNDGYFATIEPLKLIKKMNKYLEYVKVSYSAGTYICNYAMYYALKYVIDHNLKTKVGFIHYPLYKGQVKSFDEKPMELITMVLILKEIIEILAKEEGE